MIAESFLKSYLKVLGVAYIRELAATLFTLLFVLHQALCVGCTNNHNVVIASGNIYNVRVHLGCCAALTYSHTKHLQHYKKQLMKI